MAIMTRDRWSQLAENGRRDDLDTAEYWRAVMDGKVEGDLNLVPDTYRERWFRDHAPG